MHHAPHLILCNMVCSGSSAIDPIFKDLLPELGYDRTPFGPDGTERVPEHLNGPRPIDH